MILKTSGLSLRRSHVHSLSFSAATTITSFVKFPLNNTELTPHLANMRMPSLTPQRNYYLWGKGVGFQRGMGLKYTCNILHNNNNNKLKLKLIWKVCLLMTHHLVYSTMNLPVLKTVPHSWPHSWSHSQERLMPPSRGFSANVDI